MSTLLIASISWAQCPEDNGDVGVCDTLYVEPYKYTNLSSFPADVEVALRVTHDVPTPSTDSLGGLVIPLCFTSSNAAANAAIQAAKNNTNVHPFLDLDNSIFRHLPDMDTLTPPTERNWMMDVSKDFLQKDWDTRILDVATRSDIFWLSVVGTGTGDQMLQEGSRVLWATMTFTVDDTTELCIDTCFWTPTGRLTWTDKGGTGTFIPRHDMPVCFEVDTAAGNDVREIPGSNDTRPSEFSLSQNYPNPFNPSTNIEFNLPKAAYVKIHVFNIVGQRVRTLVDEELKSGRYVADWDGKDEQRHSVSTGIYFYRMQAGDFSDMKKMLLVK
jgi:hypothetical protein